MKAKLEVPIWLAILAVASIITLGFTAFFNTMDSGLYKKLYREVQRDAVFHKHAYWKIHEDGTATFTWK